jgi:SAM-dependent methyltransferase
MAGRQLTRDRALHWITRWEHQQESFVAYREERFEVMADAVVAGVARADPLILDLGCGPGSLAIRLLHAKPQATVVAIDVDPLLLELGRRAHAGLAGLRFVAGDLRAREWVHGLELNGPVDAVVSTTALHWLTEEQLRHTYNAAAELLRPGGLLLNGDHLSVADVSPDLAALETSIAKPAASRSHGHNHQEWDRWWEQVVTEPGLAEAAAERARVVGAHGHHHDARSAMLSTHLDALHRGGFAEAGVLWQRGNDRVLCAIRRG